MSVNAEANPLIRSVKRAELSRQPDTRLLELFCKQRNPGVMEVFVDRYGPLVRAFCRRVTSDSHRADDIFQATFLILAQKAHTIRRPEAMPAWLNRVARRAARRWRTTSSLEAEPNDPRPSPLDHLSAREVVAAFDEEIDRLPVAYRSALLLCLTQAMTVEETAHQLGTTHGAVRGWLQRGRVLLRKRLSRRGLDLSLVLAVVNVASCAEHSATSLPLLEMLSGSMAVPKNVAALVGGVSMTKAWGLAAVALSVLITGGIVAHRPIQPHTASSPHEASQTLPQPKPSQDQPPDGAIYRIGSSRFRHGGQVTAMAFSRDGRWLASVSPSDFEQCVRVWDMDTGAEKLRISIAVNRHESTDHYRTAALAFSDDSQQLRIIDWASFRTVELAQGKEAICHEFGGNIISNQFFPKERVIGATFSADSQTYAVVRENGELIIGNANTGRPTVTLPKSFEVSEQIGLPTLNISLSPNGKSISVPIYQRTGDDIRIRVISAFDAKDGHAIGTVKLGDLRLSSNPIMTGEKEVTYLTSGTDRLKSVLNIFDMSTSQLVQRANLQLSEGILAMSPDGKLIALSNPLRRGIQIHDRETGRELKHIPLSPSNRHLVFSPDSRWLGSANAFSGSVTVWEVSTGNRHPCSPPSDFAGAVFESDGKLRIILDDRQQLLDWRTGKTQPIDVSKPKNVLNVYHSSNRKLQAYQQLRSEGRQEGHSHGAVIVCETNTKREMCRFDDIDYCWILCFTPDQRRLIGVTQRDKIHVWDLQKHNEEWAIQMPARSFGVTGTGQPQFSQDGNIIAVARNSGQGTGTGKTIHVYDLAQKKETSKIESPYMFYGGISLSSDGRLVAGGGHRQSELGDAVFVWNVATGKRSAFTGHLHGVSPHINGQTHCDFSADCRKLLTVDGVGVIRVWEIGSGQELCHFEGHRGGTYAKFSPDAALILGTSMNAPVILWDIYGNANGPRPLGAFDAERLWTDLGSNDAKRGFSAVRHLCAHPERAIELLKRKVTPAKAHPADAVSRWIKGLDSPVFNDRELASRELAQRLDEIEPELRQARRTVTSEEARRRLDDILANAGTLSLERLRQQRTLDVLEHVGHPNAVMFLLALANGDQNAPLTIEAKGAVDRLQKRIDR